jgi:hypothetical protein
MADTLNLRKGRQTGFERAAIVENLLLQIIPTALTAANVSDEWFQFSFFTSSILDDIIYQ